MPNDPASRPATARRGAIWPILAVVMVTALAGLRDGADRLIDATAIPELHPAISVEVRARDGSLLRAFTADDGRWRLEPGEVDPQFLAMLVRFEDKRFYGHAGVDPRALMRAAGQVIRHGRVVSGGSTLSMQVARLLDGGGTGQIAGKIRQIRLALALERRMGKAEILDLYLRRAPYGGNLEGVRAASLAWFGKEPRRLTPAEAALLVALPQSPETRRPDRAPAAARAARTRVLQRMARDGVISADQAQAAEREPIPVTRRDFPALAPHLAARLHRITPDQTLFLTTIDPQFQATLEALAARAVAGKGDKVSAAIVVADHATGEILASVGAAEWQDDARAGFVDMTQALRSPGSTLKPFLYAMAFDEGLAAPETLIEDRPVAFGRYAPQNFDRQYRGTVPMREALQLSLNIPAVRLADALGPARVMAVLERTGARPILPGGVPGLALVLGGVGISLQDLVQAYGALARLGRPVQLSVMSPATIAPEQSLFRPDAAWQVADILAGMAPPPGAAPNRIAYKTGTSYGHRDALAVGFDGRHVAGVWMGRPDGTPVPGAFGGELAAPILFEVFDRLKPRPDPLPPPPAAMLMLPNARLPLPLREFRPRGTVPATAAADAPEVAFPPAGAEVELAGGRLMAKVRNGTAPFTWLANGAPVALAARDRAVSLPLPGPGFVTLSVIDAEGRASSVDLRLR